MLTWTKDGQTLKLKVGTEDAQLEDLVECLRANPEMRDDVVATLYPVLSTTDEQRELETLRDDRLRVLKLAHELTLETQTCEEAVADLVRLVKKARRERDDLQFRSVEGDRLRQKWRAQLALMLELDGPWEALLGEVGRRLNLLKVATENVQRLDAVIKGVESALELPQGQELEQVLESVRRLKKNESDNEEEIRRLEAELTIERENRTDFQNLREQLDQANDDIIWMSGATDFSPGQPGAEYWAAQVHPRLQRRLSTCNRDRAIEPNAPPWATLRKLTSSPVNLTPLEPPKHCTGGKEDQPCTLAEGHRGPHSSSGPGYQPDGPPCETCGKPKCNCNFPGEPEHVEHCTGKHEENPKIWPSEGVCAACGESGSLCNGLGPAWDDLEGVQVCERCAEWETYKLESAIRRQREKKTAKLLKACGTHDVCDDTCAVCKLHFRECEEDQFAFAIDAEDEKREVPLGRQYACPGARARAFLAGRPDTGLKLTARRRRRAT